MTKLSIGDLKELKGLFANHNTEIHINSDNCKCSQCQRRRRATQPRVNKGAPMYERAVYQPPQNIEYPRMNLSYQAHRPLEMIKTMEQPQLLQMHTVPEHHLDTSAAIMNDVQTPASLINQSHTELQYPPITPLSPEQNDPQNFSFSDVHDEQVEQPGPHWVFGPKREKQNFFMQHAEEIALAKSKIYTKELNKMNKAELIEHYKRIHGDDADENVLNFGTTDLLKYRIAKKIPDYFSSSPKKQRRKK